MGGDPARPALPPRSTQHTPHTTRTTFVAGILMFRHLPKDVFGDLQARLFPAYFATQAASGGLALAGAVGGWGGRGGSRAGLAVALVSAALNLVALEPATTRAMYARRAAARAGGPAAAAANKRFGALHGASSAANLAGLIGMCVHLVAVAGEM
jgi:hypothetical protein